MVQLINSVATATRNFASRSLDPAQRRDLAVQVVAGNEAAQTDKVQSALDREFASPKPEHGSEAGLPELC